jgi:hypothetical protein
MEEFLATFGERIEAIKMVLPGAPLEEKWPQCVVTITTIPVLDLMGQVLDETDPPDPVMQLVREVNLEWPAPIKAPDAGMALARKIWTSLKSGVGVVKRAQKFVRTAQEVHVRLKQNELALLAGW